jgi:hypothetical protein
MVVIYHQVINPMQLSNRNFGMLSRGRHQKDSDHIFYLQLKFKKYIFFIIERRLAISHYLIERRAGPLSIQTKEFILKGQQYHFSPYRLNFQILYVWN